MQNTNSQSELPEFSDVLKAWHAPAVSAALDQRILAAYRQHVHRPTLWQRFFTASVRLPVPLVAAAAVLLLAAGGVTWLALTRTAAQPLPLAQATVQPEIIAVPVVAERIVTQTVYVERPAPTARRSEPSPPGSKELKLASHVLGDNAYTDVDLSGYQPVEEMKVRIIKGTATNDE